MTEKAKTVRIIALNAQLQKYNHVKVVNVLTSGPAAHEFPTYLQAAGKAVNNEYPEFMASGAANTSVAGLPSIFIAGYSAPS